MKTYNTMITRDYCPDWSRLDVAREYLTNALDSKETWDVSFNLGSLFITSHNTVLPPNVLALGSSTNRDNKDAVGTHGEGFVVSMAVALREGLELIFYNGDVEWTPKFQYNPDFDIDILVVEETLTETVNGGNFVVEIKGLDDDEINTIVQRCLYLQDVETYGKVGTCEMGRVFFDKKGKLYVGGIWVTNTKLDYTYDFNPAFLHLNRDRKNVEDWDLQTSVAKLLQLVSSPEFVASLINKNSSDTRYMECVPVSTELKDECFKLYDSKYSGKILVSSQSEAEIKSAEGYSDIVVESSTFVAVVKSSKSYSNIEFKKDNNTPMSMVEDFFDDIHALSREELVEGLQELREAFKLRGVKWGK